METEITCPSGLRGVVRLMRVKDEELFANRKLAQSGRLITELLQTCWLRTLDMGPYEGEEPQWERVLMADRTFALIQLRILSYGPEYTFRADCPACERNFKHTVGLDVLDVAPVSEKGKQAVRTNQPIKTQLLDETEVLLRMATGVDEEHLAAIPKSEEHRLLTLQLARRVVCLGEIDDPDEILAAVEDLPARIGDDLWDQVDDLGGGVDTMLPMECTFCGQQFDIPLPFEAGFFSSRKRFTRSRRRRTGT